MLIYVMYKTVFLKLILFTVLKKNYMNFTSTSPKWGNLKDDQKSYTVFQNKPTTI